MHPAAPATPCAADQARSWRRLSPAASTHARFMRSSLNGGAADLPVPPNRATRREQSRLIEVRGDTHSGARVKLNLSQCDCRAGLLGVEGVEMAKMVKAAT